MANKKKPSFTFPVSPEMAKALKNFSTCSDDVSYFVTNRFTGCDGKALSDEFLEAQMSAAVEREDYKEAAILRDELDRRNGKPYINKFSITFTQGTEPGDTILNSE